jgi:eukaryotic-like serine/threonine-protein kinase
VNNVKIRGSNYACCFSLYFRKRARTLKQETLKQGRYRVLSLIGRGPISEVYLVEDMWIGQQVALKCLWVNAPPPASQQSTALSFFDYKVKTIARLDHTNILPILDYSEESTNEVLNPYVVMPYCPEGSLANWLKNGENYNTLSLQDVASIVHIIADALQDAHEHDVLHLKVNPSNILINRGTGFQGLMLSDFLMTSLVSDSGEVGLTNANSPIYTAPEQWKDKPVVATDQYALAVLTYILLTGRPPFQGNIVELMEAHMNQVPITPSTINPLLSHGIDTVLLRALEKEPDDRFVMISAFASAFERVIQPMAAPAMVMPINLQQYAQFEGQ